MKLLRQFLIILIICLMGEIVNRFFRISIPGNVLGMMILLFALLTGILKLKQIEEVSDFLLKHLAFFFVPAGVQILSSFALIKGSLISILIIIFISTIVVMGVTGLTVQLLKGEK